METIVTNWGNDGIQTDMLGPALAGTDDVTGVPSPLKRILLSDQFLWFGAAIAIDFSPLQNQINALAAQQLEDATAFNNFSTAITAELQADETQIAANQTAIVALQTGLSAANDLIADLQQQLIVLAQTGRYYPSAEAILAGTGSLVATLRMRAFIAPTVLMGTGNLIANPFVGRPISAASRGEGGLTAYLSGPGYLVPRLMTGVGGLTANLNVAKYLGAGLRRQGQPDGAAGPRGAACSEHDGWRWISHGRSVWPGAVPVGANIRRQGQPHRQSGQGSIRARC